MRIKLNELDWKYGIRQKVLEASELTKKWEGGKTFLLIDSRIRFQMDDKEADRLIDKVFREGMLDLTGYGPKGSP